MIKIKQIKEFYDRRKMIDTNHKLSRQYKDGRFEYDDSFTPQEFEKTIEWVVNNAIMKIIKDYKDQPNEYVIHSKSTGVGLVIAWREDRVNPDGRNHAVIVTLLPISDKHYSKRKEDVMIIVENSIKKFVNIILEEKENRLLESKKNYYDNLKYESISFHFFEGKFLDSNLETLIVE